MVVVDWVAGSSDAQEVRMTPARIENSEVTMVSFFIVEMGCRFRKLYYRPVLSAVVVAMIVLLIIMMVLPVVPALFSADVLAVNPMIPLAVARDPDHFIVASPIAGAMGVEWPVANLD